MENFKIISNLGPLTKNIMHDETRKLDPGDRVI